MPKYPLLRERLLGDGTLSEADLTASHPVDLDALLLVHDRAYVHAVVSGGLTEAEVRRLGFPWSEQLVLRSRASVAGTVAAARDALCNGIAGNLAGGTHHAFADHGEGYCVFNDHAVAFRLLQLEGRVDRAVIVDLDVHQGNGTAAIFAADESVFTFSMHGARNFPFRKQRSSLDVELGDGCEDAEYLALLSHHLPIALDAARADVLFYQGGVDQLAWSSPAAVVGPLRRVWAGQLLLLARGRARPLRFRPDGRGEMPLHLDLSESHASEKRGGGRERDPAERRPPAPLHDALQLRSESRLVGCGKVVQPQRVDAGPEAAHVAPDRLSHVLERGKPGQRHFGKARQQHGTPRMPLCVAGCVPDCRWCDFADLRRQARTRTYRGRACMPGNQPGPGPPLRSSR